VEAVLNRYPAVAEVIVTGTPRGARGEQVKASVVLRAGQQCTPEDLIEHAREYLADYKLPKVVEFIAEIPRNALGKVLRKDL
jgi:long-chain acyl-CoA synthetase